MQFLFVHSCLESIEDQKLHQTYKYEIDKRFHFIVAIVDTLSPSTAWNRNMTMRWKNENEKSWRNLPFPTNCVKATKKKLNQAKTCQNVEFWDETKSNRNKDEKLFEQKVTHKIYWIEWNEAPNEKPIKTACIHIFEAEAVHTAIAWDSN